MKISVSQSKFKEIIYFLQYLLMNNGQICLNMLTGILICDVSFSFLLLKRFTCTYMWCFKILFCLLSLTSMKVTMYNLHDEIICIIQGILWNCSFDTVQLLSLKHKLYSTKLIPRDTQKIRYNLDQICPSNLVYIFILQYSFENDRNLNHLFSICLSIMFRDVHEFGE